MSVLACFVNTDGKSVMLYGVCGWHCFTVYLTHDSALTLLHEAGRDATQSLLLSRAELGKILASPVVPELPVVEVWREVCGSYPRY